MCSRCSRFMHENNTTTQATHTDNHNTASESSLLDRLTDMTNAMGNFLSGTADDNTEDSLSTRDIVNEVVADMANTIRRLRPTDAATDVEEPTEHPPTNPTLSTVLANLWSPQPSLADKVTNADIMAKLNEVTNRLDKLEAKPSQTAPPSAISNEDLALMLMDKFAKQDKKMDLLLQKVTDMKCTMIIRFAELVEIIVEEMEGIDECIDDYEVELGNRLDRDKAEVMKRIEKAESLLRMWVEFNVDALQQRLGEDNLEVERQHKEWYESLKCRLDMIGGGVEGVMELVDVRYAGMKGYVKTKVGEVREEVGDVKGSLWQHRADCQASFRGLARVVEGLRVEADKVVGEVETWKDTMEEFGEFWKGARMQDRVEGVVDEWEKEGSETPRASPPPSPFIASQDKGGRHHLGYDPRDVGNGWGESDEERFLRRAREWKEKAVAAFPEAHIVEYEVLEGIDPAELDGEVGEKKVKGQEQKDEREEDGEEVDGEWEDGAGCDESCDDSGELIEQDSSDDDW